MFACQILHVISWDCDCVVVYYNTKKQQQQLFIDTVIDKYASWQLVLLDGAQLISTKHGNAYKLYKSINFFAYREKCHN